jgi:hypothetical protein
MSFTKSICFLTYGATLLLACQERDTAGDPPRPVETPKDPSASGLGTIERRNPTSEAVSDPQSAIPLPTGESRYPSGPDRLRPTIQLEPMDMMTAVGDSPLHVLVSKLRADDANDILDRVAEAVSLRTWPELEEVRTASSSSVENSGSSEQAGYGHVYLQPATSLADRWYALVLDAVPGGVDVPAFAGVHVTDTGKYVSRFRVGSQPVVTGVRLYEKEGRKQVVYVDFSERVLGDAQGVVVTGPSGRCQGTPFSATSASVAFPTKGNGAGEVVVAASEVSTASLQLTCSGRVDVVSELTIEIPSGFRSASGPSLNAGKPMQVRATATDWSDWGEGGKQLRLATP